MSSYSQVFGRYPYRGSSERKVIALTFDDGPNEPYSSELMKLLKKKKVKATFFQVGRCVERYPEVTRQLFADGHTIANHSLSHRYHQQLLHPRFEHEISKTQEIIRSCIGVTPALFRAPWLFRQPLLFQTLKKQQLQPVSGIFCHPLEVFQINGLKIAQKALKTARPGGIIIFHDGFDARGGNRAETIKAIRIVIDELARQHYTFVSVDQLLGVPAYQS